MSETSLTPGKSLETDLRLIRESRGLTRDDIFKRVHIRPEVLKQVEDFGFKSTPTLNSDIHRRSFVKHYADAVEIDADVALAALEKSLAGSYDGSLATAYLSGIEADPVSTAASGHTETGEEERPPVESDQGAFDVVPEPPEEPRVFAMPISLDTAGVEEEAEEIASEPEIEEVSPELRPPSDEPPDIALSLDVEQLQTPEEVTEVKDSEKGEPPVDEEVEAILSDTPVEAEIPTAIEEIFEEIVEESVEEPVEEPVVPIEESAEETVESVEESIVPDEIEHGEVTPTSVDESDDLILPEFGAMTEDVPETVREPVDEVTESPESEPEEEPKPRLEQLDETSGSETEDAPEEPAQSWTGPTKIHQFPVENQWSPYAPPIPGAGSTPPERTHDEEPPPVPKPEPTPVSKREPAGPTPPRERPPEPVVPARRRERSNIPSSTLKQSVIGPPDEDDLGEEPFWIKLRGRHWLGWAGLVGVVAVIFFFVAQAIFSDGTQNRVPPARIQSVADMPTQFSGIVRLNSSTDRFVTLQISPDSLSALSFEYKMWTHSAGSTYAETGTGNLNADGSQILLVEPYGVGGMFLLDNGSVRLRSVRRVRFPRWEFTGQFE